MLRLDESSGSIIIDIQPIRLEDVAFENFETPKLCDCGSWTIPKFRNSHGYCNYCGGFDPGVIRERLGDSELLRKINLLGIHRRLKMLSLCGFPIHDERTI